jgi:DNA-directed RNA polymerase delta subunit
MGDKNSSDVEILNNIVYLYRKVIFDLNFIDISSEWLLLLALLKKKALQEHGRVSFLHINPTVEKLACALCVETIVVEG